MRNTWTLKKGDFNHERKFIPKGVNQKESKNLTEADRFCRVGTKLLPGGREWRANQLPKKGVQTLKKRPIGGRDRTAPQEVTPENTSKTGMRQKKRSGQRQSRTKGKEGDLRKGGCVGQEERVGKNYSRQRYSNGKGDTQEKGKRYTRHKGAVGKK